MGEWLYYNFAAESFHTQKLCRFYSIAISFYLVWYQNIRSALFDFVTKHAGDRRTELRLPRRRCVAR